MTVSAQFKEILLNRLHRSFYDRSADVVAQDLLAKAMAITRSLNEQDLLSDHFFITDSLNDETIKVVKKPRIGVDYAGEWAKKRLRFYIKDSLFISKK